jgi:hypothetical protein
MRNERGPGGGRQVLATDLGPWRQIFFSEKLIFVSQANVLPTCNISFIMHHYTLVVLLTSLYQCNIDANSKKSSKTKYWCRMLTFQCLLVEQAIFHLYIGTANTWLVMTKMFAFL